MQVPCPAGIYGAEHGLASAACSPVCEPFGALNAADSVTQACAPRPCAPGYYCPPASTGPHQMPCGGVGLYCPGGSAHPITASDGYYTTGLSSPPGGPQQDADNNTRTLQRQCAPGTFCLRGVRRPCPAGTYADQYGANSTTCQAPCEAGFYCLSGSPSPTQFPCGNASVYCPQGSPQPVPVPTGYYSNKASSSTPRDVQVGQTGQGRTDRVGLTGNARRIRNEPPHVPVYCIPLFLPPHAAGVPPGLLLRGGGEAAVPRRCFLLGARGTHARLRRAVQGGYVHQ